MTTNRHFNGILAGLLLMATGCADNNPWSESGDTGGLRPTVAVDASVGAAVTRAQMEELPEEDVPSADDFTLEITKVDGSYSKSWRMAEFDPQSVALKSGRYVVTARYGDPAEEGNKRPYFVGSADVTVRAGETTPVNIEAALGNALVEITQTDNFLSYFSDFNLQLHSSETGAYVPVPRAQTDPTYVHPGQVAVVLDYTNWEGKSATVRPVTIDVKAQKYYHVKLDLDTEMSGGVLKVTFDNGVEEEEVEVDLSAVENAPEPTITSSLDKEYALLEGTRGSQDLKFTLMALAGIRSVAMTMVSDPAYTFSYAGRDLCTLDADGQAAIEATGIKTLGIFKNRDKMAEVDLADFVARLPEGAYEVTLTATDAFTREAAASMKFQIIGRQLSVKSVAPIAYGATEAELTLSYNGTIDDVKNLVFSVTGDSGSATKVTAKSVAQATQNGDTFVSNDFVVALEGLPSMRCERGMWVKAADEAATSNPDIKIVPIYPEYSVEADAFAKRAYVKVASEELTTVMDNMRFELYDNSQRVTSANISTDPASGMVTITGLSPKHNYKLAHSLDYGASSENMLKTGIAFTTEEDTDVPNGDFERLSETLRVENMVQGGTFKRFSLFGDLHNSQSYVVSEPEMWSSTNSITCNTSYGTQNSWFILPSVYNTSITWESKVATEGGMGGQTGKPDIYNQEPRNSNSMVIRNVAWDSNGSLPSKDTSSKFPENYYNHNEASPSLLAIGKLFLGKSYNDGIVFSSRPSILKGYYTFTPDDQDKGEKGVLKLELLSGDQIIAYGNAKLSECSDYSEFSVKLNYTPFTGKATRLRVEIASSDKENETQIKVTKRAELFLQEAYGAVLKIDDLVFEYD